MYPAVKNYGNAEVESFGTYYARWPKELSAIPSQVVEDWIYRHWNCFKKYWLQLQPHKWEFELATFSNERILEIDHIGTWIQELDAEGIEYVGDFPRGETRLAKYMRTNGTFPVPIIVAKNSGHIVHPRSGGEFMKGTIQLIEGHSRLACIRGMISSNYSTLLPSHSVWQVSIP